jgi:predicted Zn finger-like uncharacterized protein
MIVTCPSCEAKYRVEQSALEVRRGRVKCASCAHVWTVAEAAPKPAPAPQAAPAERAKPESEPAPTLNEKPHTAIRARAATRAKRNRAAVEGAGWAGVAACLVAVLGAAFVFRIDVVDAWPRAAGAYAAVGVEVDPVGLAVEALQAELIEEDGAPVLVVEGQVRNVARSVRDTVPLTAVVRDASGAVLAEWSLALESLQLDAGAAERFRTTFPAPPEGGARVDVVIASPPNPPADSPTDRSADPQANLTGPTSTEPASPGPAHSDPARQDHASAQGHDG